MRRTQLYVITVQARLSGDAAEGLTPSTNFNNSQIRFHVFQFVAIQHGQGAPLCIAKQIAPRIYTIACMYIAAHILFKGMK